MIFLVAPLSAVQSLLVLVDGSTQMPDAKFFVIGLPMNVRGGGHSVMGNYNLSGFPSPRYVC